MRRALASIVVVTAGLLASLGRADPPATGAATTPDPKVQLAYTRGTGADLCPDEEQLKDGVAARLGWDPFDASAKTKVSARISKDGKTLRAVVETIDATGAVTGSRELSSTKNDCIELASAVTLTISMVIDPLGKATPPPPPPPVTATTTAAPPPPPPPSSPPTVVATAPAPTVVDKGAGDGTKPRGDALRFRLGVAGQGAVGFAPRSSFGATALFGLDLRTFSIDLEGRRDAPVTAALGKGEITTSVLLASIVPCLHQGIAFGCGVVTLGSLNAKGGGVDVTSAQSSVFLGAGVRGGVEVPISREFSLIARLEVLAPLIRTIVRLDGDEVWSAPTVAGSLALGGVVFF